MMFDINENLQSRPEDRGIYLTEIASVPDLLGKELPVPPAHDVAEHGVAGALVAAESALVVRLHLGVTLGYELLDVAEPHHRIVTAPDPLLEADGDLDLRRRRIGDWLHSRQLFVGIGKASKDFFFLFCF